MKHNFLNDDAMGYAAIMIFLGIFGVTAAFIAFTPVMNFFAGYANSLVGGSNHVSAQTINTVGFIIGLFVMTPAILIIGFLVNSYYVAVYEKESRGGGLL